MANALYIEGKEQQRQWAARGIERGWQATTVLTEPDTGSDVGAIRNKAVEQPDGTWHLEDVKRFISGGDVGNTAENIFHLVAARPEGAGPSTKRLSLFYVPNYLFDPDNLRNRIPQRRFRYRVGTQDGAKVLPHLQVNFRHHRRASR